MYTLTVTKTRPMTEEEKNRNGGYGRQFVPDSEVTVNALSVTLTDAEFAAVKKAALEAM